MTRQSMERKFLGLGVGLGMEIEGKAMQGKEIQGKERFFNHSPFSHHYNYKTMRKC